MPNEFYLEIISPEGKFLEGQVESIIVPGLDGYVGILADHIPVVISLKDGLIKIKQNNVWKEAVIHGGFIEVEQKKSIIICNTVEWPENIDINRALAAKERAEERLRQKQSQTEYMHSKAALARALSRLQVTSKNN